MKFSAIVFVSSLGISCTKAVFLLYGSSSKHVPIPVVTATGRGGGHRGVNPTYYI